MKKFLIAALLLFSGAPAWAAITAQTVEYMDGETVLAGYLAYDDANEEQRPGILVVHEWKGLGEYAQRRARQLAELGYVAFAVDMYGKDIRPQTHEEAAKQAGIYKSDRHLMRQRILAAHEVLKQHPLVIGSKIGAIGYCFGGTTVLELARSGAGVKGVVSFHGDLSTPTPEDAKNIRARVLVFDGAQDKFTQAGVEPFKKEMGEAGVDMQFVSIPGAVHSFTVPEAGDDPSTGMAYNEEGDKMSWQKTQDFFKETFSGEKAV